MIFLGILQSDSKTSLNHRWKNYFQNGTLFKSGCWTMDGTRYIVPHITYRFKYVLYEWDFIILLERQIWPMEPKLNHFFIVGKKFSNSWLSRIMPINVPIKTAHCDCEKNVCRECICNVGDNGLYPSITRMVSSWHTRLGPRAQQDL